MVLNLQRIEQKMAETASLVYHARNLNLFTKRRIDRVLSYRYFLINELELFG